MRGYWGDEEGLTTVEYALLLGLIIVLVVAVWAVFVCPINVPLDD